MVLDLSEACFAVPDDDCGRSQIFPFPPGRRGPSIAPQHGRRASRTGSDPFRDWPLYLAAHHGSPRWVSQSVQYGVPTPVRCGGKLRARSEGSARCIEPPIRDSRCMRRSESPEQTWLTTQTCPNRPRRYYRPSVSFPKTIRVRGLSGVPLSHTARKSPGATSTRVG